jgi:hypothetical protein
MKDDSVKATGSAEAAVAECIEMILPNQCSKE